PSCAVICIFFFFSSRRRHTRFSRDWSSDVCSSDLHYFVNQAFLEPNQLLRDMDRIAHLPGIIVHGRYDVICPLDNAWALQQVWRSEERRVGKECRARWVGDRRRKRVCKIQEPTT